MQEGKSFTFSIIIKEEGKFIGCASIDEELGFWIGEPYWRQGYGKEAMRATVNFAIEVLGLKTLKASVLEHNIPSRRVFESLGFTLDRIAEHTVKGKPKKMAFYSFSSLISP